MVTSVKGVCTEGNTAPPLWFMLDRRCNNLLIILNTCRILIFSSLWHPLLKNKAMLPGGQTVQPMVEVCAYIWRRPCTLQEERGFPRRHQIQPTPKQHRERTLGRWASPQTCGEKHTHTQRILLLHCFLLQIMQSLFIAKCQIVFFLIYEHQCFASLSVQNVVSRYLLAVTCAHWFIIMHSTGQKHATVWTNKKQGFELCGSRFPDMCILKSKLYGLPEKIEAEKTGQSARGRESSHTSLNDNLWDQDCIPVMAPIHTPERKKKPTPTLQTVAAAVRKHCILGPLPLQPHQS